jgi:hypothetical protein
MMRLTHKDGSDRAEALFHKAYTRGVADGLTAARAMLEIMAGALATAQEALEAGASLEAAMLQAQQFSTANTALERARLKKIKGKGNG